VKVIRQALFAPHPDASYREGVRAMMPLALAISVWGLVTGVAMVGAGMTIPLAIVLSLTVFAGSAQLATLPLLAVGAPMPVVYVTALLVNLRFVIFAAASRRYFSHLTRKEKLFSGYLNGDLGFALFQMRYRNAAEVGTPEQLGFFYGTAVVNWVAWQVSSIVGILLGGLAPTSWGLDLAASLALLGVLVPMANRFPTVAGIVVTGVLAVLTVRMPMKLGLLVSVVVGACVALLAETVVSRRSPGDAS
jgi:predicted branched-subunit amino acid permease